MTEEQVIRIALAVGILLVAALLTLSSHSTIFRFKERRRLRSERRHAEAAREGARHVQENIYGSRYLSVVNGRSMGRTFAGITATAARQQWVNTTTSADTLSQADLRTTYDTMYADYAAQTPNSVTVQRDAEEVMERAVNMWQATRAKEKEFHRRRLEKAKLKKELSEPFWAWHERKEQCNETKRMGSNNIASSGAGVRVFSGIDPARDIPDRLASDIRSSGVVS